MSPTKEHFWTHDVVSSLFVPWACRGMVRKGAQGNPRAFWCVHLVRPSNRAPACGKTSRAVTSGTAP